MTEQELREKIVEIAISTVWKDCYGDEVVIDRAVAEQFANALIAAGLTFEPMIFRTVENKPYSYTAGELANWKEDQDRIAKLLHRAEVYYEALLSAAAYGDTPPDYYIQQAEKELAEEKKDD